MISKRLDLNAAKSASDQKDYRIVVLDNGLECLLVSTYTDHHLTLTPHHHFTPATYELAKRYSAASTVSFQTDRQFTFFDQLAAGTTTTTATTNSRPNRNFSDDLLSFRISDVHEEEDADGYWQDGLVLEVEDVLAANTNNTAHTSSHRPVPSSQRRPTSSYAIRESSSKQSLGNIMGSPTASTRKSHQRPSMVGGVMSGEAGRKLSRILPISAEDNASLLQQQAAKSLQPTTSATGTTTTTAPPLSSLTHAGGRLSISIDTINNSSRPPALRLSRLRVVSDAGGGDAEPPSPVPTPSTTPNPTAIVTPSSAVGSRPTSPRKHRLSNASARGSMMFHSTNSTSSSNSNNANNDPEEFDTCAVAMGVGAGSFATPAGLDGLAHFLEHMLFMGSKMHPKENEFDTVLAQAGGACNAFTDTEQTVYHFVAPQPHVKDCLQVFSQFFVSPLLLSECSARELRIIESEFASRKNLDRCRLQEIWRETSRENTPYAKFTCGNLQTLTSSTIDVNAALREFYDTHYTTQNMKFVMLSGEPLDELERTVVETLRDCRSSSNNNVPPTQASKIASQHGFPWDQALGQVFRIVPTGTDVNEVQMTWQLDPKLAKAFKSKPCEYIAHLLSHECAGSVINELKSRGWAHDLVAGVCLEDGFTHNSGVSLFNITVSLTTAGMSQWIYVVALLFEFLAIIKRQGLQRWIFDELQQVSMIHYRFKEEIDAKSLVQQLCSEMLGVETEEDRQHLLNKSHLLFEWDPTKIHQVLDVLLNVNEVRIDLLSTRLAPNSTTAQTAVGDEQDEFVRLSQCDRPSRPPLEEQYTGAMYWKDAVPEAVLDSWKAVIKGKSTVGYISAESVFPESLGVPPRNPYIASDFDLKHCRQYDTQDHLLIGAELRFGFAPTLLGASTSTGRTSTAKKLSGTATLRRTDNVTLAIRAGWEFGVVTAVDCSGNAILVRYPAKEGVRRWHQLDSSQQQQLNVCSAEDFLRKMVPVDRGNGTLLFTSIPRATPPKLYQSSTTCTTQQDDFDFSFQPADSYLWKKHFPKLAPTEAWPEAPVLVSESNSFFSLWALPDTSFRSPRVQLYVSFLTPNVADTAMSAALADLFAIMVFESLVQESYMGFLVDLNFDIEIINGMGIQLHFSGFSHKLMDMLKIVLRRTLFFTQWVAMPTENKTANATTATSAAANFFRAARSSMTPISAIPTATNAPRKTSSKRSGVSSHNNADAAADDEFDDFVHYFLTPDHDAPQDFDTNLFYTKCETLMGDYMNASTRFRSGKQVSSVMFDLLCNSLWTPLEKAQALRSATPQMLVDFAAGLFTTCRVEGLAEGNLDEKDCTKYFKCIKAALHARNSKPIRSDIEPVLRSQTLPVVVEKNEPVSGLIHVLEAVESTSHSVELFFQIGVENPEDRVLATVLEHLMAEPLYSELRTKQQLGYSLKCGVRAVCGTIGFVFEITSNVHGPEQLAEDVDEFLKFFREKLLAMSSEEYVLNASSLAMGMLTKAKTLQEQSERHWNCILGHALHTLPYLWNSQLVECGLVRTVASKSRVLEAFDAWLDPVVGKRRRASVYVVGVAYKRDQLIKQLNKPCVTYIGMVNHHHQQQLQQQAQQGGKKSAQQQCILM